MIVRRAYRYRLEPTVKQRQALARVAGSARWVWNQALKIQKERLALGEFTLGITPICKILTIWRNQEETAWLAEGPCAIQQQKLRDLDRALKAAFSKKDPRRFPRFKKRGLGDSFRYPDPKTCRLEGNRLRLPKLGAIKVNLHRPMEGTPRNVTITRDGSHWYAAIQIEKEIGDPVHPSTRAVGVDLGVARFATLSDGSFFEPAGATAKQAKRLAKAQRLLARKKKFSSNWKKQKVKIQKIQRKIRNIRQDFLHKVSLKIASENQAVILEDLKIKNMSASARGTVEIPGKNVRQKAGLNRAIQDQGWYKFRCFLGYKLEERGGLLGFVDPKNTSRRCPVCGHTAAENRLSQAVFRCQNCGHSDHADVNAAVNILGAWSG